MNNYIIFATICSVFLKGQVVLEALEQGVYSSTQTVVRSGSFIRNDCGNNGVGKEIIYSTTKTYTYESYISQEDADMNAMKIAGEMAQNDIDTNGQSYANANAKCWWSVTRSNTQSRTYPSYQSLGMNYGAVSITGTYYYTAVSDVSWSNANLKAEQEASIRVSNYLNNPSVASGLAYTRPAYVCHEEYEEEYITGTGMNGSRCPTSIRRTGRGMAQESTDKYFAGVRMSNGFYGAMCTLRGFQDPTKTTTIHQSLNRYKTRVCNDNGLKPPVRSVNVVVGTFTEVIPN